MEILIYEVFNNESRLRVRATIGQTTLLTLSVPCVSEYASRQYPTRASTKDLLFVGYLAKLTALRMTVIRPSQQICTACSSQLLFLFKNGFCSTAKFSRPRNTIWPRSRILSKSQARSFMGGRVRQATNEATEEHHDIQLPKTPAQMEAIARQARQNFGETLPTGFLSPEEYAIYKRLYGSPLRATKPEDVRLLQNLEEEEFEDEPSGHTLLKEDADGNFEEVEYNIERVEASEEIELSDMEEQDTLAADEGEEFKARYALFRDIAAAQEAALGNEDGQQAADAGEDYVLDEDQEVNQEEMNEEESDSEDIEGEDSPYQSGDALRTHPSTAAGRFRTYPFTLQLPRDTVIRPVTSLLADASNKHLSEVAQKVFRGSALPNSTSTPFSKFKSTQGPIALEASQSHMGEMEGNAFMAAIMPGAYVTVMSTLVETRKRLGSEWIRELLNKKGGPLILDAGAGGAGVQAWREILRAEWKLMHPDDKPAPLGKATVITGSPILRHRASRLLDDTTFLPRLPDYNPSKDHPSLGQKNTAQPRKQYDIIVAPNTLWTLKEDYSRKNQVQNFWSLLNPKGGVLVLIEKGVPRGFELIAAARETLLKYHIASPESLQVENQIQEPFEERYRPKETGMIIAPCTNHFQCPMYLTSGQNKGRKDFCHFSQRYVRPPYLQRILAVKDTNHEDIKFSYLAVQRGVDQRKVHNIIQGQPATDAAFAGYGGDEFWGRHDQSEGPTAAPEAKEHEAEVLESETSETETPLHTLSLPRSILPALKRRGHVTLDLCTPAGRIERWTVPKSFGKQAYRDARKSSWGDLWALGAKTRIYRNIRLGDKSKKASGKDTYELKAGADGAEDTVRVKGSKPKFEKRTKKAREKKPKKQMIEDDFLM